ncbi:MAG: HEAT repeat domain-containing protein [Planctomycetota bacterium]
MLTSLLLALVLSPAQVATAGADDEATALAAELVAKADQADPQEVRRLADLKTRPALDGLMRLYDTLGSLHMRRIALKCFASFDGLADCQDTALQKLTDIATLSIEGELRDTAVDELAGFREGRRALGAIVASGALDAVRERALRHHVGQARPEDIDWYRSIWRAGAADKEKDDKKKERKKDKEKDKEPATPELAYAPALRELAYEGVAGSQGLSDLAEDTRSKLPGVRRRALEELVARGGDELEACAEERFGNREERPDLRLFAARALLDHKGPKYAETLYKEATRGNLPLELLFGLAESLAALDVPALHAQAVKSLGDGQPDQQRFVLRLVAQLPDPKIDKALLELSASKHPSVALEAVRVMGLRGNPTFVPRLEKLLKEKQESSLLVAALEALTRIRAEDEAWRATLASYATHADEGVRNAVLEALGKTRDVAHLPILLAGLAHPGWSTRLTAARALEELHALEGLGAMCERIAIEDGRMRVEFGEILTRMTGQPFRTDGKQWQRWWKDTGAGYRFPNSTELAKLLREREDRADRQTSRSFRGVDVDSRFFGLRIASHHVAFVVDVSGSMEEPLPGSRAGKGPTRMEAAKKELLACFDALEGGTHFNIVTFSQNASSWRREAVEATEQSFTDAQEFVAGLGGLGGTNLYGGLELAFEDPEVDTIFLLSDGEPSQGELIDPQAIREAVQGWLAKRQVVIHTVSIGERFPLLEWLATDSGGAYRTYP